MNPFDLNQVTESVTNTRFAAKLQHFATIDSTNIRAVVAATDNAPDGTVFIADEQTAGRGRGGHSWHSAAGDGLYVSVIVRPNMALTEALWLSLAAGLAAQRAIYETTNLHADIRWPNDLLLGTRKCGGILVETASFPGTPAQLRYAVIGIGINTNHESFPPELSDLATSLRIQSGVVASRESLLANLLLALDSEIMNLEGELNGTRHGPGLLGRFTAASSWVRGKRVRVDEDGGYTGVTVGLNRQGFLQVARDDGKTRTVLSGGRAAGIRKKMLLAIDVGNTNTVLGLFELSGEAAKLISDWRITTPVSQTASEFGVVLANLFALSKLEMSVVDGIAISSVVPPFDPILKEVCDLYFTASGKIKPLFIEPGIRTGLPILTDNPSEVGADRIVNCVAAFERFGGPSIVVDMGTATTFDCISKKGEFLGGAIAPGLRISADALFARAARLPRVEIKRPPKIIGTNTVDNMQIGLYYGYIGLVDGILERMIAELGPETKVCATGGLAKLIASGSKYITTVDDMLTLTGLRIIYQRNQKPKR